MGQRVLSLAMMQRSTEELRLARLEFLQSQMDPHFIFNAINVIMPLCLRDPKQAYALLGNFSDYLHGNLFPKESNSPIYVYEEVDLIRAYLALENARMPDFIDYETVSYTHLDVYKRQAHGVDGINREEEDKQHNTQRNDRNRFL